MAFKLNGVSDSHFQHLNRFFSNGFENDSLIEQSQNIHLPQAVVHAREWYFNGIRMGYSEWLYKKPADLKWQYDIGADLVTFQVNLTGSVFLTSQSQQSPTQLFGNFQQNLFYSNDNGVNEGFIRPEALRASIFFIQFRKDTFLRLTQGANDALNSFSDRVLKGGPAILSPYHLPVNADVTGMIRSITHCRYKDGLKKLFLLSKSIEFLVLQAEACNSAQLPSYKYLKTKYELDGILHAREYLLSHLADPPTLSELAKIIGLNEYKLKRGYKEVFGNTAFGHLSDARLDLAKTDLLDGEKSTSQIADELGYSSIQHFSKAFKSKFGQPPSKYRKS